MCISILIRMIHIRLKNLLKSPGITEASWELTDSNHRPSACKADALNQLS